MNFNQNRLRFVHCEHLFSNLSEITEYVRSVQYEHASLYAEPMIFKYGDEKNPSIVLAIGSVGEGKFEYDTETGEVLNKTFYIDFSQVEKDIEELYKQVGENKAEIERIDAIVKNMITACGFNEEGKYVPDLDDHILGDATSLFVADKMLSEYIIALERRHELYVKDTNSIDLNVEKGDSGVTLTSNVKLGSKIYEGKVIPNIIVEQEDGIFTSVDLDYSEEESKLTLTINGDQKKDISLPVESHVIKGEYDPYTEELILTLNNAVEIDGEIKNEVRVNIARLIDEWDVLGEASETPIVLTKEHIKSVDGEHEGMFDWQDILTADVRILDGTRMPNNILTKDSSGKYLYVDGSASNIAYVRNNEKINVQKGLDEKISKTDISKNEDNSIVYKEDGLFSFIDVNYDKSSNTLIFRRTNPNGDILKSEYVLNSVQFIQKATYDVTTEEIVIVYTDGNGKLQELRIPLQIIVNEFDVDNTNSTVTLTIVRNPQGKDTIKANANIAKIDDNILENVGHELYVKGSADNIKMIDTILGATVESSISTLNNKVDTLVSTEIKDRENAINDVLTKLKKEFDRATSAEDTLQDNIDAEYRRALAAEEELTRNLNFEISNSKSNDERIESKFDGEVVSIKTSLETLDNEVKSNFKTLSDSDKAFETKLVKEIEDRTAAIHTLSVDLLRTKENLEAKDSELERILNEEINYSKGKDNELENALNEEIAKTTILEKTLTTALTDEIRNRENSDRDLLDKINGEFVRADRAEHRLEDLIKTEEIERINSDNTLTSKLQAEYDRAKGEEDRIKEALTNEINTSNSRYDDLNGRLEAEKSRSMRIDEDLSHELNQAKLDLSYVVKDSGTINLTKSIEEVGSSIIGEVKVSIKDGNLINTNGEPLYATVDLLYDTKENVLTLTRSGSPDKTIKLNEGSLIESIVYDDVTKELVITYYDSYGNERQERVNVRDLFNQWVVETNHLGAVQLTKELNYDGNGTDKLIAEVIVSDLSSNLLVNDKGSLYVSNSANDIVMNDGTSIFDNINDIKDNANDLLEKILAEKGRAELAESKLQNNIDDLSNNVTTIDEKLSNEIKYSKEKDEELEQSISLLDSTLKSEVIRLEKADHDLADLINEEYKRADKEEKALKAIIDLVESESKGRDRELNTLIDNNTTNLTSEISRALDAERELRELISKETDRAITADDVLRGLISSEIERAVKEEGRIESKFNDAIGDSRRAEADLDIKIGEVKNVTDENTEKIVNTIAKVEEIARTYSMDVDDTSTIDLTKRFIDAGGFIVSADVKISPKEGNNIVKDNEGLYSNIILTYSQNNNTLHFTTNGKTEHIPLVSVSTIDKINYLPDTNEIEIVYVSNGEIQRVTFPASGMFKPIVTNNDNSNVVLSEKTNEDGATELSANLLFKDNIDNDKTTVTLYSTEENKLKAKVNVGGAESVNNILEITSDGNSLFVNGQATNIEMVFKQLGWGTETDPYVEAEDVEEAIHILDDRLIKLRRQLEEYIDEDLINSIIKDIINLKFKTDINAIDTASVDLTFNSTENSSSLKANVVLSKDPHNLLDLHDDRMVHEGNGEGVFTDGTYNGVNFDGSIDYLTFNHKDVTGEDNKWSDWTRHLQLKRDEVIFNSRAEALAYLKNPTFLSDKKDGEPLLARYNSNGKTLVVIGFVRDNNGNKTIQTLDSNGSMIDRIEYVPNSKQEIISDEFGIQTVTNIPAESLYFEFTDASSLKHTIVVPLNELIEEFTYPTQIDVFNGTTNSVSDNVSVKEHHNVKFDVERNKNNKSIIKADIEYFDCGEYDGEDYLK